MAFESIELDLSSSTNEEWKEIMRLQLASSNRFEIHCWNLEQEEISLALPFGTLEESEWQYGKIISGSVSDQFTSFLLNLPKPEDTDLYNKMTPFFSIFLDNGFSSEHYGTELGLLTI